MRSLSHQAEWTVAASMARFLQGHTISATGSFAAQHAPDDALAAAAASEMVVVREGEAREMSPCCSCRGWRMDTGENNGKAESSGRTVRVSEGWAARQGPGP